MPFAAKAASTAALASAARSLRRQVMHHAAVRLTNTGRRVAISSSRRAWVKGSWCVAAECAPLAGGLRSGSPAAARGGVAGGAGRRGPLGGGGPHAPPGGALGRDHPATPTQKKPTRAGKKS